LVQRRWDKLRNSWHQWEIASVGRDRLSQARAGSGK